MLAMALSTAMLSACGASPPLKQPGPAPDPVTTTRIERELVCPGEVTTPQPAKPELPAGATIDGNAAGMDWLSQAMAWAGLLSARLNDAAKTCAAAGVKR